VPDEMLHEEVERWCEEIIQMSPRYLEVAKASSNVMYHQMRDNMVNSLGALIQAIGSPDMLEGANAFMEKRKPQFPPRSGPGNKSND
ncbi:MAG: hypothetical protein MKZ62_05820, partial [Acidimicrobiales bacterium]|nr:hypothetical protein [Acidimicrobiales bacterium]